MSSLRLFRRNYKALVTAVLGASLYGFWWLAIDAAPGVDVPFVWWRVMNGYQLINILGHFLVPVILFAGLRPKRFKLAIAQGILSSLVMDSPMWGIFSQYLYSVEPWDMDWASWSMQYFHPLNDRVWWHLYSIPVTGGVIFLSLVGRWAIVLSLVYFDYHQNIKPLVRY